VKTFEHDGMMMEERREPAFVKFEKVGQVVSGVLLSVTTAMVGDPSKPDAVKRPAVRYTVDAGEGERVCFLGTFGVTQKLGKSDCGKFVIVKYQGEDRGVTKNGNALRLFDVAVSQKPVVEGASLAAAVGITDDDIPF
jgi:hypothetical protein